MLSQQNATPRKQWGWGVKRGTAETGKNYINYASYIYNRRAAEIQNWNRPGGEIKVGGKQGDGEKNRYCRAQAKDKALT